MGTSLIDGRSERERETRKWFWPNQSVQFGETTGTLTSVLSKFVFTEVQVLSGYTYFHHAPAQWSSG